MSAYNYRTPGLKAGELMKGVNAKRRTSSRAYKARKVAAVAPVEKKEPKTVSLYPQKTKKVSKAPFARKLRSSITPGSILILLAGRFRGSRVVFLKQLDSGLLLISGPFKVNGVPLRRVNQAYVIATSTTVDVAGVDVSKIDDAFFARVVSKDNKDEFFADGAEKKTVVSDVRKAAQKAVDTVLNTAVDKVPHLSAYLSSKFSLKKGQYPHLLKF